VGTASHVPEHREGAPPITLLVRLELPGRPIRDFSYDFAKEEIRLGRDPQNDIQVPLTTVSRYHARIFFERGDYFLEDRGSTHGTEHNGVRMAPGEKRLLRDGDRIVIVSFEIIFKQSPTSMLERQPGERTEVLARRMVQEMLSSLGGARIEPPALRVMNGKSEGRRYELGDEQSEVTIGRNPDCDITLNDPNVSRRHCLVKRNWHGFTAQDLGSKNGVLVNDVEAKVPRLLKDGDVVQVGSIKLTFIDPPSRLLEQMGGASETLDPEGVGDTALSDDAAEEEAGSFEAEDRIDSEAIDEVPRPARSRASDRIGSLDLDVMPLGDPPNIPKNDPLLAGRKKAPEPVPKPGAKRGFNWEILILLSGALFLVALIGLGAYLVL
jgi:pSer/pThr/pTyr-binding forkhead associated (FHA) protein